MKPNILFITTDQQHYRMLSCAGETSIQTPACDGLAAEGIRFEHCYTANPVCVPARYSFMTGYMPHIFNGMEDNFKGHPDGVPKINDWVDTPCMGHLLRDAGYHTAYGGKSHIEGPYRLTEEKAKQFGFEFIDDDIYDKNANACADFIKREHDKPFMLWASFDQPHDICQYIGRRKNNTLPEQGITVQLPDNHLPSTNESAWMRQFREGTLGNEETYELGLNRLYSLEASQWDADEWILYRSVYRHFMQETDRYIQILLDALDESGQLEHTVIIFTSDHGDHDGAHQLTMKRSFFEESAHVPLIVRMPNKQSAGKIVDSHLVSNGIDLIPSLCDFAQVPTPSPLQGISIKPYCEGKTESERSFVVCETRGSRMLRSQQYKYCLYTLDLAEEELYDLQADPGEMINLAKDPALRDVVLEHRADLAEWTTAQNDERGSQYLQMLSEQAA